MKLAKASIILLAVQLTIISIVPAWFFCQRWTCPRVWTRTRMWDPYIQMRGNYLDVHLTVNACGNAFPPEDVFKGVPTATVEIPGSFPAELIVKENRLFATRVPDIGVDSSRVTVLAPLRWSCDALPLQDAVSFYIPEHKQGWDLTEPGLELWVEVTVPPKGPPRPIQLALKEGGAWKPLAFQ